jgi:hypothetical protein
MNKFQDKTIKLPYQQIYNPRIESSESLEIFNFISNSKIDIDELIFKSNQNEVKLDSVNDKGNNLIHHLIEQNSISENQMIIIISKLVQNNVNPDQPNKFNMTPLHYACLNQLNTVIEFLIKTLGVNPNYVDDNGFTPFYYALIGKKGVFNVEPEEKKINNEGFVFFREQINKIKKSLWTLLLDKNYNLTYINNTS